MHDDKFSKHCGVMAIDVYDYGVPVVIYFGKVYRVIVDIGVKIPPVGTQVYVKFGEQCGRQYVRDLI